eukprot:5180343-Pyramimonas_sp.AAC.1
MSRIIRGLRRSEQAVPHTVSSLGSPDFRLKIRKCWTCGQRKGVSIHAKYSQGTASTHTRHSVVAPKTDTASYGCRHCWPVTLPRPESDN